MVSVFRLWKKLWTENIYRSNSIDGIVQLATFSIYGDINTDRSRGQIP